MFDTSSTRDRILLQALELFAEHGYSNASIRQLSSAAGITAGSLYNHFSSKEAILQTLAQIFTEYCTQYDPTREMIEDLCRNKSAPEAILCHAYDYREEDSLLIMKFTRMAYQEQYTVPVLKDWILHTLKVKSDSITHTLHLLVAYNKLSHPLPNIEDTAKLFARSIFMLGMEATMHLDNPEEMQRLWQEKQAMFRCFTELICK